MKNAEKTPEGFRGLAEKSRAAGDHRVAAELEKLATESEEDANKEN